MHVCVCGGREDRGPDLHSHFQARGSVLSGQLGHIISAILCLFIPSFAGLRVTDLRTNTQRCVCVGVFSADSCEHDERTSYQKSTH